MSLIKKIFFFSLYIIAQWMLFAAGIWRELWLIVSDYILIPSSANSKSAPSAVGSDLLDRGHGDLVRFGRVCKMFRDIYLQHCRRFVHRQLRKHGDDWFDIYIPAVVIGERSCSRTLDPHDIDEWWDGGDGLWSSHADVNVVRYLLESGVAYRNYSVNNNNMIVWACYHGYRDVVEFILPELSNPGSDDCLALRWAAQNGRSEIVRLLLEDGRSDPSVRGNLAIRWACQNGHVETVKVLLQDGRSDPSAERDYAIQFASEFGHADVVELLLKDSRVNPAANDNASLKVACRKGFTRIVKLLLTSGHPSVDPSAENDFCIVNASRNGYLDIVQMLLRDQRVNPSAQNNSAYKWAQHNRHKQVMHCLTKDSRCRGFKRS